MPVATTSGLETKRFDLKSLEGGYVIVRRMTFGQYMRRREQVSQMFLKGGKDTDGMEGMMQLVSAKATELDFANCITEHNLTDDQDRLLDFKNTRHVESLNPRIGDEIGKYIDEMNQFNEEEQGN